MQPLLSIIIPSYNRKKLLARCLNSINNKKKDYEVIVVDDGSDYDLKKFFFKQKKKININFYRIKNSGRSKALFFGIDKAKGKFSLILDDDDKFLKSGLHIIFNTLRKQKSKFYVFGTLIKKKNFKVVNSIPPKTSGNYISIIADSGIKTDMKQIIDSKLLKKIIKKIKIKKSERVPTGLIWAKVSQKSNCIFVNQPVVLKEYLKDGITYKINLTKFKSSTHMKNLYWIYFKNQKYESKIFRIISLINFIRYSLHSKKKLKINFKIFIFFIFSLFIFYIDLINLKINEKKN